MERGYADYKKRNEMSNIDKTYLTLLMDIAIKKEDLLNQMILETIKQAGCFQTEEFQEDQFDEIYYKKLDMIKQIEELDEGFQSVYDRVKEEMKDNKYAYETEIKSLQAKIRSITEKGIRLQTLENENKLKFETNLSSKRQRIKDYKVSKKTAATYYKNMMKQFNNESYFYNKSK